ncbi:MAG TPA: hypothetical protein VFS41_04525 [Edaphobacter sp.]|nr:hypothetical protein [Edaphobacter sp.]
MEPRAIIVKERGGAATLLLMFGESGEIGRVDITGSRGLRLAADIVNAHLLDECKRLGDGEH